MYKSLRQQTLHYFARPHQQVLLSPLHSAAAWRGDELRQSSDWIEVLSTAEVAELHTAVQRATASGKALARLSRTDFPLPTLQARIAQWREQVRRGRGFVLVRGLPVDAWTPQETETFYWCFGQHFGLPGAQNPQGDLIGHVRDQRTGEDVRLYRTNQSIAVHCDAADVVGLLCLRPAQSGGLSRLVSSVTVYNALLQQQPQAVARLYQPFYFDTKGEGGLRAFPVPPCAYADGELRTFWQSDYYRSAANWPEVPALSSADLALLDAYDALASSPELYLDMDLQAGDLQLVSNHTVLHARTAFTDAASPDERRHLLRLWISLPEQRRLNIRWLTARSWLGLAYTASRELTRRRFAA